MIARAGWYIDPDDPGREMYWNGAAWLRSETRERSIGAVAIETVDETPLRTTAAQIEDAFDSALLRHAERQTAALESIRTYLAILLTIVVLGLVLGVIGVVVVAVLGHG